MATRSGATKPVPREWQAIRANGRHKDVYRIRTQTRKTSHRLRLTQGKTRSATLHDATSAPRRSIRPLHDPTSAPRRATTPTPQRPLRDALRCNARSTTPNDPTPAPRRSTMQRPLNDAQRRSTTLNDAQRHSTTPNDTQRRSTMQRPLTTLHTSAASRNATSAPRLNLRSVHRCNRHSTSHAWPRKPAVGTRSCVPAPTGTSVGSRRWHGGDRQRWTRRGRSRSACDISVPRAAAERDADRFLRARGKRPTTCLLRMAAQLRPQRRSLPGPAALRQAAGPCSLSGCRPSLLCRWSCSRRRWSGCCRHTPRCPGARRRRSAHRAGKLRRIRHNRRR
jgi:hypothetical protein